MISRKCSGEILQGGWGYVLAEHGPGTQPALWAAARAFLSSPQCLTVLQTHKAALVRPLRVSVSALLLKNTHTPSLCEGKTPPLYTGTITFFSPRSLKSHPEQWGYSTVWRICCVLLWLLLSSSGYVGEGVTDELRSRTLRDGKVHYCPVQKLQCNFPLQPGTDGGSTAAVFDLIKEDAVSDVSPIKNAFCTCFTA